MPVYGELLSVCQRRLILVILAISSPENFTMLKKILLGLLIVLIIAQFIQPPKNKGAAATTSDITHAVQIPDSVMFLLKTACYDCHSNSTNYPWYSKITPVNWWLKNHIDDGKKHLNFSVFKEYDLKKQDHKLEEIIETVKEHEMPLKSYLWIHSEARLTDSQRATITTWASNARAAISFAGPK